MIGSLTVNGSNMKQPKNIILCFNWYRARPAAAGISLKSAEAAPKEPESTSEINSFARKRHGMKRRQ